MRSLTERQAEILDYVIGSIEGGGRFPPIRRIGLMFGIRSTNAVADHLSALERKGFIAGEGGDRYVLRYADGRPFRTTEDLQDHVDCLRSANTTAVSALRGALAQPAGAAARAAMQRALRALLAAQNKTQLTASTAENGSTA